MLTACIPGCLAVALQAALQALLHVGFGFAAGEQDVSKESDVRDGQAERVDFGEPFLVRKSGNVTPEPIEGRIDAQHPLPLTDVGGPAVGAAGARRGGAGRRGAVRFSTPRPLRSSVQRARRCYRATGGCWKARRGRPREQVVCRGGIVQKEVVQMELVVGILVPEEKFGSGVFLLKAVKRFLHSLIHQSESSYWKYFRLQANSYQENDVPFSFMPP